MKSRILTCLTAMTLFAALAVPMRLAAQDGTAQANKPKHHHYKLVDLGTFGGPNSGVFLLDGGQILNSQGTVAECAETTTADPDYPNFNPFLPTPRAPDPLIFHTFSWQNGALRDLGALPGVNSSCESWISGNGLIVGASENGTIDPLTGWPAMEAVLWKNGQVINLGTFGGNESFAIGVNNRGEVVGAAANAIPDPFSVFFGWGTQTRGFLWQNGVIQDLGTLGGPDALATQINERGQIFGASYISSIPNPVTGIPPFDAFLYENGKMEDIPNAFGGTQVNPFWANNQGELVGNASLPGETMFHPFLWDGGPLLDLGTFGGDFGDANMVNDTGEIVGAATFPGDVISHGFLWENGNLTDLGTVDGDGCSNASSINLRRQIVGLSFACDGSDVHAFLWENGQIFDLDTLIPPGSDLTLFDASNINDRGEIAGLGATSNGDTHAVLLIPCGEGDEGCGDSAASATPGGAVEGPKVILPENIRKLLQQRPSFGMFRRQLR